MFDEASLTARLFLIAALGLALAFEFVNGFHDTANAVATVIYTNTLRPTVAVVWSGVWNLLGVLSSSGAVAFGLVALLPVELILHVGSAAGFAMVFSLLLSAILWNLGTWYLGLPASSSHTLIGSLIGVGMANALLKGSQFGDGVSWGKAREVGVALLVSPVVGFLAAYGLYRLMRWGVRRAELYADPRPGHPPPAWIRAILLFTCTGVSFAHGSNDGQKGMGLIMLILIGLLPGSYALNPEADAATFARLVQATPAARRVLEARAGGAGPEDLSAFLKRRDAATASTFAALARTAGEIETLAQGRRVPSDFNLAQRSQLRSDIYLATQSAHRLAKQLSPEEQQAVEPWVSAMEPLTQFIPFWVKAAVALALGLGTMVGWERIVVTVGEKIGKSHLSYAQGAVSEMVAASTIAVADVVGLPVSTTHVLSSAVAGSMTANGSGLQSVTVRNLALAWILTLPVCVFLGAMLFALALNVIAGLGLR